MTAVRIAHAEPWLGRLQEGGFAISEFLVVLADDAGGRALPVWLTGPDGDSLWQLLGWPTADTGLAGVAEELAGRMLPAADVTVTAVAIDELVTEVTAPPRHAPGSPSSPPSAARIELASPAGTRHVMARLGYGLALAAAAGAPVKVADAVMDRLAVPVQDGDLLRPLLDRVSGPVPFRPGPRPRFEPRNLAFADGLDRRDFGVASGGRPASRIGGTTPAPLGTGVRSGSGHGRRPRQLPPAETYAEFGSLLKMSTASSAPSAKLAVRPILSPLATVTSRAASMVLPDAVTESARAKPPRRTSLRAIVTVVWYLDSR
jgi:hypothetical protein